MANLRWLEELHIEYHFVDGNKESLVEISKLSMLKFLDLFVPHIHVIPKGVSFTKLKGFVIQIGGRRQTYYVAEVVHKKTLILGMKDLDTPSMLQVKELIESSDGIIFQSVDNPNNIVPTMYCESLGTIMLYRCNNLLSLVDSSDCGGENTKNQYFSKLEHLFLLGLDMLHVLQHEGLANLQTLTIQECMSLTEVIWDVDGGDIDMVEFRRLVKIELRNLENLKSFYAGKAEFPSLEKVEIYRCDIMDKWDNNGTY
ncbi:hypothetical protein Tco_0094471, partial [Tanacetum coccineum]